MYKNFEMAPGWHRLPNGVVVYSDPIALRLADPKDSIEGAYKSKNDLSKGEEQPMDTTGEG